MNIATDTAYKRVFDCLTAEGYATLEEISDKVGKDGIATKLLIEDLYHRHGQIVIREGDYYSLLPGRELVQGGANKVIGKLVIKDVDITVKRGSGR